MSLEEVAGPPGPPWNRRLHGTLDELTVESECLRGNRLGDPFRRPLYVYRSPGVKAGTAGEVPAVLILQGFTGQLDMWHQRDAFSPTNIERYDGLFHAGEAPDAVLVFADAFTSLGGSQFLNSPATGRYLDYLVDEVMPFVESRYPVRAGSWGVAGKSSGGYGAMVLPMLRPGRFRALASHAGDSLFEASMLPRFPVVARNLRDNFGNSWDRFHEERRAARSFDFGRFGETLELYAYACAYSPGEDDQPHPRMPFQLDTGRLDEEVWQLWLDHDPVRMIPSHLDALRSLRHIHLDAGTSDEAFLDLGAQAVSDELARHGIEHTLELFRGRHGGISWRYPIGVGALLRALIG